MVKIFLDKRKIKEGEEKHLFQKIKNYLAENNFCYVLLTCSEPSEEGNMQVEMDFEGDEDLASYLLESSREVFKRKDCISNDSL